MRYDLYRLGPREFENLAQAVTLAELGPDVTVYGAGADGGREATQTDKSTGLYTVVQAKYKEVSASSKAEATWLIAELRKEFKEWRESTKRGQKPDRFILATNVTLSAAPKSGGMDRVEKVLGEECTRLGIREYVIWHAENFNRFLDMHAGIRTSYAAWVLPGDILTLLYKDLTRQRTEANRAIKSYMAKELLNDRYANLDQAGSADDRTVPLADVFFDVPIGLNSDRHTAESLRCLETLISACDIKHSPEEKANTSESDAVPANRFVLVGGPGQGKSTASQFLCQLYRAQLIKDHSTAMRNPELKAAVHQINEQAEKDEITPKARRWPVNIPLTRLADELAQGKCTSLLDYVAQRVSESASSLVNASDMREWLRDFPWLLVLDGLDEVPGSSNRTQVLSQISNFLLEADELNSDLVVVATTRPQGYTDDFSPKNYQHYVLTPLDKDSALSYGRKLAYARHGKTSDRVHRLMNRLQQAADEPSTAHLMGTPLQVTIMAVLLDRVGKAPKDRFTLFADYYRVIYERELEKEGSASNLLRDHKSDIDAIHADVGLLLQTRSERSGETESRITVDELNSIISDRLTSEGHAGNELDALTSAISRAATHRLVFLVPSRDSEVSFEIRSLQEFWAADALMNCNEEDIGQRLRIMSASSHWRNVLLFALGNIFATRRNSLRDTVVSVVAELNAHSERFGNMQRRILTGSRLAVEILNDGMVRAPRYEAILVEESLKLLSLPPSGHISILATCISDRGMEIARDFVSATLQTQKLPSDSLFIFLGVRITNEDPWALGELKTVLARATDEERFEVFSLAIRNEVPGLLNLTASLMADPALTRRMINASRVLSTPGHSTLMAPAGKEVSAPAWFATMVRAFNQRITGYSSRSDLVIQIGPYSVGFVSVAICPPGLTSVLEAGFPREHWISSVIRFSMAPSKADLARLVSSAAPFADDCMKLAAHFPWIVYYAMRLAVDYGETQAAEMIARGDLGDINDWIALESQLSDLYEQPIEAVLTALSYGFDDWRQRGTIFVPFPAALVTTIRRRSFKSLQQNIDLALKMCESLQGVGERKKVARFALQTLVSIVGVKPESIGELFAQAAYTGSDFVSFGWLEDFPMDPAWIPVLDEMGRNTVIGRSWVPYGSSQLGAAWVKDPSLYGVGRLVCQGFDPKIIENIDRVRLEWERVRASDEVMNPAARVICLIYSHYIPPLDEEESRLRVEIFGEAVNQGDVEAAALIRHIALDHSEVSRKLLVSLCDSLSLTKYDREAAYERMVQMQSTTQTEMDYSVMRPR